MKKIFNIINNINNYIAIHTSFVVSTMGCFYAFVLFSCLPLLIPSTQNTALYISNTIQLAFLPLILVAGKLLNKNSEKRAADDHDALMTAVEDLKAIMAEEQTEDNNIIIIQNVLTSIHEKLDSMDSIHARLEVIETHLSK